MSVDFHIESSFPKRVMFYIFSLFFLIIVVFGFHEMWNTYNQNTHGSTIDIGSVAGFIVVFFFMIYFFLLASKQYIAINNGMLKVCYQTPTMGWIRSEKFPIQNIHKALIGSVMGLEINNIDMQPYSPPVWGVVAPRGKRVGSLKYGGLSYNLYINGDFPKQSRIINLGIYSQKSLEDLFSSLISVGIETKVVPNSKEDFAQVLSK